jgi:hypothetical protein
MARAACDAVPLTHLGLNDQLARSGGNRHPLLADVRAESCAYVVHPSSAHDGARGRDGGELSADWSSATPSGSSAVARSWCARLQAAAATGSKRSVRSLATCKAGSA